MSYTPINFAPTFQRTYTFIVIIATIISFKCDSNHVNLEQIKILNCSPSLGQKNQPAARSRFVSKAQSLPLMS